MDILFSPESLGSSVDWCSYPSPLTLRGPAGWRPFPLPGHHCPSSSPLHYCHCVVLCLFLLIAVSVLQFEKPYPSGSNILKQTRSPGFHPQLSPTLFPTSLLFSPALSANVTSSLWSPSTAPRPKIIQAISVLLVFPRPSVILGCIIPKEPRLLLPRPAGCHPTEAVPRFRWFVSHLKSQM